MTDETPPENKPGSEMDNGIMAEVDKVTSLIVTARRLLADRKMVDLTALSDKVEGLVKTASTLPQDQRGDVAAAISKLAVDLDCLATELTNQYQQVATSYREQPHQVAAKAYQDPKDKS